MNNETLSKLVELCFQYGPFTFALIFLYGISRWAYRNYNAACVRSNPPANDEERSTLKRIFIASFVTGSILVLASVVWWFQFRPTTYIFLGEIRDLNSYERIASDNLYFRTERKAIIDAEERRNEHFAVISNKPFKDGQVFEIEFAKGETPRNLLELTYNAKDDHPEFRIEFDSGAGKSVLHRVGAASNASRVSWNSWINPVVHAQVSSAALQSSERAKMQSQSAARSNRLYDSQVVTLQNPSSDVGAKITALERLNKLDPTELQQYLDTTNDGEPFLLTIADLTRHSDKELAYQATVLIGKADVQRHLSKGLSSPNLQIRKSSEQVVLRLDKSQAANVLQAAPKNADVGKLAAEVDAGIKTAALVPTGTINGDRYYIKIAWNPRDAGAVSCLAKFFSDELLQRRTLEQQKSVMSGRSDRLIWTDEKEWAVSAGPRIRACGGQVAYIHPWEYGPKQQ